MYAGRQMIHNYAHTYQQKYLELCSLQMLTTTFIQTYIIHINIIFNISNIIILNLISMSLIYCEIM